MADELALMIPIVSIVLGIGVAFWSIYWDHQKKRLQYQERQLMIEKGMEPPPVLLDEEKKKVTPEDCLRRGTIMLFLGYRLRHCLSHGPGRKRATTLVVRYRRRDRRFAWRREPDLLRDRETPEVGGATGRYCARSLNPNILSARRAAER